jgi:hydrophobe/amphiphile efflux-3 (HAE3) family protein
VRAFWSWLGLNAGRHVRIVTLVGLALTIGLGVGIGQLRFKTDNASYLNRTDTAYKDNAIYQRAFGGDDMVSMFTMSSGHTVEDLLASANLAKLRKVTRQLDAVHDVLAVITPLTILEFIQNTLASPNGDVTQSLVGQMQVAALAAPQSATSTAIRQRVGAQDLARLAALPVDDRVIGNTQWDHFLLYGTNGEFYSGANQYFVNQTHAVMYVRLAGNLSIEQESRTASTVTAIMSGAHFQGATVITTGSPSFLKALNDYLRGGMLRLTAIAALLMVAILVLLFNVRWRLLPFGIVTIGLIWAFGLVAYLHVPLTLATISALPIMLGIGIDYAIQMHSRVEEEVVLDRVAHPIQATARNLCPALLVVTFDAVFAFLALQFSAVPMIRQFGLMLAIGVAVICLCTIVSSLAVLGIREHKSPTRARPKKRDFSQASLSRIAVRLGSLPRQCAIPLALASVAVFAGGLVVEGKLVIQTNPVQWINQRSSVIHDIHALERNAKAGGQLNVLISGPGVMTNQGIAYIDQFENRVARLDSATLQPAMSLVSAAADLTATPGAAAIPPKVSDVLAVYAKEPPAMQRLLFADGGRALDLLFISKTSDLNAMQAAVDTVNAQRPPVGIDIRAGGIAEVGAGLLQDIQRHRALLTYLAIIFVMVWLTIRLRSFVRALLSMVPVLIAVGLANLVAYALSIRLSPATAVGGPLVVAVCTEFTSLMLLRYIEERSRGLEPRAAFNSTSARTGRAFIVSGLTAITGVAVMATSSMTILSGFGEVVAFNVIIALVSALVILPPIVVWADQRNWVSRGMLRPDPDARPLVEPLGSVQLAAITLGADSQGADSRQTQPVGADLVGSELVGADPVGASLAGSDLAGAEPSSSPVALGGLVDLGAPLSAEADAAQHRAGLQ